MKVRISYSLVVEVTPEDLELYKTEEGEIGEALILVMSHTTLGKFSFEEVPDDTPIDQSWIPKNEDPRVPFDLNDE